MNTVRIQNEKEILWIYLSRPQQLNALNEEMIAELGEVLDAVERDNTYRCVIFTGEGEKAFAAGADIKAMENMSCESAEAFSRNGRQLMDRIENLAMPTIAAINGFAFGGGLEVALACDFRFAREDARLGLPEVTLGIMPGWDGSRRLARVAGYGQACELVFTGKAIMAKRAKECGIVNEIFPISTFTKEITAVAESICRNAPVGIRYAKYSMRKDGKVCEELFGKLFLTQDQRVGMRNFNRKCKTEYFEGK